MKNLDSFILSMWRFLVMNTFNLVCSIGDKRYTLDILNLAPGTNSILWSYLQ